MDNLKIYQICHHLITYFATLIFPKKSQLGPIFKTGGSNKLCLKKHLKYQSLASCTKNIHLMD